jgi:hypothetical protein
MQEFEEYFTFVSKFANQFINEAVKEEKVE